MTASFGDGAVFYMNGREFARVTMPTGAVAPSTLAKARSSTRQQAVVVPSGFIQNGLNVLSVEVSLHLFVARL